jgi:hypothetical protein
MVKYSKQMSKMRDWQLMRVRAPGQASHGTVFFQAKGITFVDELMVFVSWSKSTHRSIYEVFTIITQRSMFNVASFKKVVYSLPSGKLNITMENHHF